MELFVHFWMLSSCFGLTTWGKIWLKSWHLDVKTKDQLLQCLPNLLSPVGCLFPSWAGVSLLTQDQLVSHCVAFECADLLRRGWARQQETLRIVAFLVALLPRQQQLEKTRLLSRERLCFHGNQGQREDSRVYQIFFSIFFLSLMRRTETYLSSF